MCRVKKDQFLTYRMASMSRNMYQYQGIIMICIEKRRNASMKRPFPGTLYHHLTADLERRFSNS